MIVFLFFNSDFQGIQGNFGNMLNSYLVVDLALEACILFGEHQCENVNDTKRNSNSLAYVKP